MTEVKRSGNGGAAMCAALGDKEQVFAWLEKDFQARSGRRQRSGPQGRDLTNNSSAGRPSPGLGWRIFHSIESTATSWALQSLPNNGEICCHSN